MSISERQGCQHFLSLHSTKSKDLEKTMYLGWATTTLLQAYTWAHIQGNVGDKQVSRYQYEYRRGWTYIMALILLTFAL